MIDMITDFEKAMSDAHFPVPNYKALSFKSKPKEIDTYRDFATQEKIISSDITRVLSKHPDLHRFFVLSVGEALQDPDILEQLHKSIKKRLLR